MSLRDQFDAEKAIEVLLYVAAKCPDTYTALKVLYFADKAHLAQYGRLICGDIYVAMDHGPVPSGAYDLVKYARGDSFCWANVPVADAFCVQGYAIIPKRAADLEWLSESDIECLDAAIAEYGHLSFLQLRQISHRDPAFKESDHNSLIPLDAIVRSLPNSRALLDYLHDT